MTGFISYCGGLPAPESADNPLGYKFSWSSRGVLLALLNSARLYKKGSLVEIDGQDLMGHAQPYFITPALALVAYPNRDSTTFREKYEIPEAETVIRGTLRYQGFPAFIKALVELGFLNAEEQVYLKAGQTLAWVSLSFFSSRNLADSILLHDRTKLPPKPSLPPTLPNQPSSLPSSPSPSSLLQPNKSESSPVSDGSASSQLSQ